MKTGQILLATEALVLGGPTTAVVVYGLPVMAAFGVGTLINAPAVGALALLQLCGLVWALIEYWRLAANTARLKSYRFGLPFWAGVVGATTATFGFVGTMPAFALSLFIVPPAMAAVHFVILQWRRRSHAV